MPAIQDRRIGIFQIDLELINEMPETVRQVLGTVIVLHAETKIAQNLIEYTALCDAFEEVGEGDLFPSYDINVSEDDAGEMSFEWSKE